MASRKNKNTLAVAAATVLLGSGMLAGQAQASQVSTFSVLGSGASLRSSLLELNQKTSQNAYGADKAPHSEAKDAEGKCGEGKCGEGACGDESDDVAEASKKPSDDKKVPASKTPATAANASDKSGEGKCGEGKCGE